MQRLLRVTRQVTKLIMSESLIDQSSLAAVECLRDKPMIIICGCTGTGKTKLSIQLAEWLMQNNRKCEIINADAMQVIFHFVERINLKNEI